MNLNAPLLQRLRLQLARSGHLDLHLDFDGTLVPIAADPERCYPDRRRRRLLHRLVQQPRLAVAIVSGRSLADLERRVCIPGLALAGNHGLEIALGTCRWRHPEAVRLVPLLQALAARAELALAGIPGVWVENKTLSLSLHSRRVAPSQRLLLQRRLQTLQRLVAACPELMLRRGKEVLELRPAIGWSKASASRLLRGDPAAALDEGLFYAGDDSTDEDVFRACPAAIGVKVGPGASAARFQLADSMALLRVLEQLLRELEALA